MEGYVPEYQIDHKNKRPRSNHWGNLRHSTVSCNQQNKKKSKNNKSGFPGVSYRKLDDKWVSQISVNKKVIHLGFYNDPLEAALVRFTVENQCLEWTCNYKSELVKAIKTAWPEFRF